MPDTNHVSGPPSSFTFTFIANFASTDVMVNAFHGKKGAAMLRAVVSAAQCSCVKNIEVET